MISKNLLIFNINSKKIILVSIKKNINNSDIEKLGAEFFNKVNQNKIKVHSLITESVIKNTIIF